MNKFLLSLPLMAGLLVCACAQLPAPAPSTTPLPEPVWTATRLESLPRFESALLGNRRFVRVLLPAADLDPASLPLVVINDGQDWERLRLWPLLEQAWTEGTLPPAALVLVPAVDRMQEYGLPERPNSRGQGSRAELYARFLTEELLPVLAERFGLSSSRRVIVGTSLGGLSAFGLAWSRPEVFQRAVVLSGSFWWRLGEFGPDLPDPRLVLPFIREAGPRPQLSFWIMAGTRDETDDRDGDGLIDAVDDSLDVITALREVGISGERVVWRLIEGGRHDTETWARVLPEALAWALGD